MLKIPPGVKTYEFPTSTIWFDENGILYSISKKAPKQTLQQAQQSIDALRKLLPGEKVCMLVDVTNTGETSREVRDYAADELPKMVKAVALLSDSALGKMLANLFFNVKQQPYPVKMFTDEKKARTWLKKHL